MKPTKEEIKKLKELKKKQLEDKELIKKQSWKYIMVKNFKHVKNCLISS